MKRNLLYYFYIKERFIKTKLRYLSEINIKIIKNGLI